MGKKHTIATTMRRRPGNGDDAGRDATSMHHSPDRAGRDDHAPAMAHPSASGALRGQRGWRTSPPRPPLRQRGEGRDRYGSPFRGGARGHEEDEGYSPPPATPRRETGGVPGSTVGPKRRAWRVTRTGNHGMPWAQAKRLIRWSGAVASSCGTPTMNALSARLSSRFMAVSRAITARVGTASCSAEAIAVASDPTPMT